MVLADKQHIQQKTTNSYSGSAFYFITLFSVGVASTLEAVIAVYWSAF